MSPVGVRMNGHGGRKVLIVGNLFGRDLGAAFYMILPKLLHGFIRLGCTVHVFNDREVARGSTPLLSSRAGRASANRKLLATGKNFRPDLVLLGHCDLIAKETLEAMRSAQPGLRIAYRNVDALTDAKNRARVQRRADTVDAVFVTTAAPIHGVPAGSRAAVYFMPNPVDPAIETGRGFARSDQAHDLFFATGTLHDSDERLPLVKALLDRLPALHADIRGTGERQALRGARYFEAMADSRMGLSISRPDNVYLYASDRMSQLLGNGLLTFQARSSGFQDIFGENELAFYDGLDDLVEKLQFFTTHDAARRKTAAAGWRAAHSMFASHRVAKYILERSFDEPLSESYPWPTAIRNAADADVGRRGRPKASIAF